MNTREIAVEYRLAHWAGIMRERLESGLSIKAYCESSGLHVNVYYYWQRKLREAASQSLLPTSQDTSGRTIVPKGWAMVSEVPPETKNCVIYIEIGKSRIEAAPDVDLGHLAKVCQVLMGLC
jgi:transposase-like protein